jgi:hypothetical protein
MKRNPNDAGVQYVDYPHGEEQCSRCSMFIAPTTCTEILGPVRYGGWCKLFKLRTKHFTRSANEQ